MSNEKQPVPTTRLSSNQLHAVSAVFKPFVNTLEFNCITHALYRGELFCNEEGNIQFNFVASTVAGTFAGLTMEYNPETNALRYLKKVAFESESAVKKAIYALVSSLEKLPFTINTIYFDFSRNFSGGSMEPSAVPGEQNIYLIGDFDLHTLLVSGSDSCALLRGKLGEDWEHPGQKIGAEIEE